MSITPVEFQCPIDDGQVTCSHCGDTYNVAENCLPGPTPRDSGTRISHCYCPTCRLPEVVVH